MRWLRPILIVALFGAIAFYLTNSLSRDDWNSLLGLSPNWWWVLFASLVELLNRFLFGAAWILLLGGMKQQSVKWRSLLALFATSWLARYLPGTGTWMALRVAIARDTGFSRSSLASATALEGVLQLIVLSALGLLAMSFSDFLDDFRTIYLPALLAIVIIGFVVLLPRVTERLAAYALSFSKRARGLKIPSVSSRRLSGVAAVFTATSIFSSLGILLVGLGVEGELINTWLTVFAVATLSSIASLLAIFAPAGIGVRESVLVAGLAPLVGVAGALSIALLHRALSVMWDIVFFGATRAMQFMRR